MTEKRPVPTDDDIEMAARGMVEADPSTALLSNVMRAVRLDAKTPVDERRPVLAWRMALAAAAVVVLAGSAWFGAGLLRVPDQAKGPRWASAPAKTGAVEKPDGASSKTRTITPAPQPGSATRAADTPQVAGEPQRTAPPATELSPAEARGRAGERLARRAAPGARATRYSTAAGAPDAERIATLIDPLPEAPPLRIEPIPDPAPVVIAPVVVSPIDIPEIRLTPVGDEGDARTRPDSAPERNENRPAGDGSAPLD